MSFPSRHRLDPDGLSASVDAAVLAHQVISAASKGAHGVEVGEQDRETLQEVMGILRLSSQSGQPVTASSLKQLSLDGSTIAAIKGSARGTSAQDVSSLLEHLAGTIEKYLAGATDAETKNGLAQLEELFFAVARENLVSRRAKSRTIESLEWTSLAAT